MTHTLSIPPEIFVAITIFGVGSYEWGNSEGYPVQGDQVPAYHRCDDNYPSSDVKVYLDETIGCERCGRQYPGNNPHNDEIRQLQIEDAAIDWMKEQDEALAMKEAREDGLRP